MAVRVLGPLDTGSEALSPRERAILTALIVRVGSTVSPSELADALWGDDLPPTWGAQVKNSVARIRSRLGRMAIETVGSEYRLGLDPTAIDSVTFERTVSAARGHALRAIPIVRWMPTAAHSPCGGARPIKTSRPGSRRCRRRCG